MCKDPNTWWTRSRLYAHSKKQTTKAPANVDQINQEISVIRVYKCRSIYTKARAKTDPEPSVNITMVIFMVMIGISVVLGIPYMMFQKKGKGASAKSFAQVLEDSRKRRGGHTL